MENNLNNTNNNLDNENLQEQSAPQAEWLQQEPPVQQGYGEITAQSAQAAVQPSKNRMPVIIALVCLLVAGAITAVLLFLFGGGGSSYEKAERNAFNALSAEFSKLMQMETVTNISETGTMKITLTEGLLNMVGMDGMADMIGSLTLDYDAVIDGSDIYAMFNGSLMGESVSFLMWQLGEQVVIQVPELLDYYILANNDFDYSDIMALASDDQMIKKFTQEIGALYSRMVDKYLELTADAVNIGTESVKIGDVTKDCEVYLVSMSEEFFMELVVEFMLGMKESPVYMELCNQMLESFADIDDFDIYDEFDNFESMVDYILEELDDYSPETDEIMVMKAYINGKDIIKRDFIIEDVTVSFAGINGNNYVQDINITDGDFVVSFINSGSVKSGAYTGQIDAYFSQGIMKYSANIKYTDCKIENNDLFSGKIEISVPEVTLSAVFECKVTGDTQTMTGSVSAIGLKLLDIESSSTLGKGRTITAPDLSGGNVLDLNDPDDLDLLAEMAGELVEGLEEMVSVLGMLGIGGNYYDDYDWDDFEWELDDYDWDDFDWEE